MRPDWPASRNPIDMLHTLNALAAKLSPTQVQNVDGNANRIAAAAAAAATALTTLNGNRYLYEYYKWQMTDFVNFFFTLFDFYIWHLPGIGKLSWCDITISYMSYMVLFLFPFLDSGTNAYNSGRFLTKHVLFDFFL